ncbi:MAG TPA: mRNA surveillance protein pelota [Candidatus Diapherotrites archaeon]|uniref:Protein pelota homolog n=1 Tax=Candidatus Iainarchaeum sp. TaxID=3101447 RepID=A0A7J4IWS2_9ARCH|nr:mRNA surveillance protein pelota [Candidatus Diapherotrites archaeon]
MQILKVDRRNNHFEVVPDTFEDLWHLERIIEKGDHVSGSAERKIKAEEEGEKAYRQIIFVELEVEKAVFHEASGQLRIQGIVTFAKPQELVPLKAHHTLEAETGKKISVTKKKLRSFDIERLERAKNATGREKALLIVMDDEEAELAFLRDIGLESKARIISGREGKRFKSAEKQKSNPFFEEIYSKILDLAVKKAVVAGPGFEKQNFEKFVKEKKDKIEFVFESTNSVGITGLNELIKSGKIDKVIEGFHLAEEAKAVERVLSSISNGLAALGEKEVAQAVESSAASEIVALETTLTSGNGKVQELLDRAEQYGTKIHFIANKSDPGRQLEGIGGIAAVLRYRKKWD